MKARGDLDRTQIPSEGGEERTEFQKRLIEELRSSGQPVRAADRFMLRMRDTLQAKREHRKSVVRQVDSGTLGEPE